MYAEADGIIASFLFEFGSLGTSNGQFNLPEDVVVDNNSSNIYVADTNNHRIQIFDESGNHIFSFGSIGFFDGSFLFPEGVVISSSGSMYVADRSNRIQIFDESGNHLATFGSFGAADGQFKIPEDIAVDNNSNNIYIADRGNHRIQIFDESGNHLETFGSFGAADGQFNLPEGITLDSAGNIYVADTNNHRIQIFDESGNHLTTFGSLGTTDGQFTFPESVAVDNNSNNIYIADRGNHRIQIFDESGNHLATFGSFGAADGQFSQLSSITFDSAGNIYVADTGNHRIQVLGQAIDDIPPAISLVGDSEIFLEATIDTYAELGATVTDNDPNYAGTIMIGGDVVDENLLGQYVVTYDATPDAAGNIPLQVIRTITVQDTIPPELIVPDDIALATSNPQGAMGEYDEPTATDLVGIAILSCDASPSDVFPIGDTIVTCVAEDTSGNQSVEAFTITVVLTNGKNGGSNDGGGSRGDTTPPSLGNVDGFEISSNNLLDSSFLIGDNMLSFTSTNKIHLDADDFQSGNDTLFPLTFYTGEIIPVQFVLYDNSGPHAIQHVALYTDVIGTSNTVINESNAWIIWEKDKPLMIQDKNDLLSEADVANEIIENDNHFTFSLTFDKPMDTSNIVLYTWDEKRNGFQKHLLDVWQIKQKDTNKTKSNDGMIASKDTGNNRVSSDNKNNEEKAMQTMMMSSEQEMTVKRWAGYAEESATDYDVLNSLGINTGSKNIANEKQHIFPMWFKQFAGKSLLESQIEFQEFVNAAKYIAER